VSAVVSLVHSLRLLVRSRAVLHLEITVAERVRGTRHRLKSDASASITWSWWTRRDCTAYYMRSRTHLALGKDTPCPRPVTSPSTGHIVH